MGCRVWRLRRRARLPAPPGVTALERPGMLGVPEAYKCLPHPSAAADNSAARAAIRLDRRGSRGAVIIIVVIGVLSVSPLWGSGYFFISTPAFRPGLPKVAAHSGLLKGPALSSWSFVGFVPSWLRRHSSLTHRRRRRAGRPRYVNSRVSPMENIPRRNACRIWATNPTPAAR